MISEGDEKSGVRDGHSDVTVALRFPQIGRAPAQYCSRIAHPIGIQFLPLLEWHAGKAVGFCRRFICEGQAQYSGRVSAAGVPRSPSFSLESRVINVDTLALTKGKTALADEYEQLDMAVRWKDELLAGFAFQSSAKSRPPSASSDTLRMSGTSAELTICLCTLSSA